MKDSYGQVGTGVRKFHWQKSGVVSARPLPLRGGQGSTREISRLELIRHILMDQFKVSFRFSPNCD